MGCVAGCANTCSGNVASIVLGGLVGIVSCAGTAPIVKDLAGTPGAAGGTDNDACGVLMEGSMVCVGAAGGGAGTGGAEAATGLGGGAGGAVSLRVVELRDSLLDAEREGPRRDATTSERSMDLEELSTEGPELGYPPAGAELLKVVGNGELEVGGGAARVSARVFGPVFARYNPNSYLSVGHEH